MSGTKGGTCGLGWPNGPTVRYEARETAPVGIEAVPYKYDRFENAVVCTPSEAVWWQLIDHEGEDLFGGRAYNTRAEAMDALDGVAL